MKYFPFRVLAACIVLPPLLYLLSVSLIETWVERAYQRAIPGVYLDGGLQGGEQLLSGGAGLESILRQNIDRYLNEQAILRYGLAVQLTVRTQAGELLYPLPIDPPELAYPAPDTQQTATRNYRLLQDGLDLQVHADLKPVSPLSFGLIGLYSLGAVGLLYHLYRRSLHRALASDQSLQSELSRLKAFEDRSAQNLQTLESDRARILAQLQEAKKTLDQEKQRAVLTEDEMLKELLALEARLQANQQRYDQQKEEIEALRREIEQQEQARAHSDRKRGKGGAATAKRFNTLYKSIVFHDRAVEGFLELTEELKIKAEEVIHQLDRNPDLVTVKRKVFGKKNRKTAFEVIFAYRGRLYYTRNANQAVEILAIGTKLTQNKDLEYLDRL